MKGCSLPSLKTHQLAGWSIDQLIGQLISRPLSWSVGWSVLVSWSVGWSSLLAGWAVGWWAGDWSIVSNARVEGGTNRYDLFDLAGNQRCGRCAKANSKDYEKEQTIEGLNAYLFSCCNLSSYILILILTHVSTTTKTKKAEG